MKTNNEMISEILTEIDNARTKKRINGKLPAILVVTLSLILCIGIGAFAAKICYPIFSDEWIEEIENKAVIADGKETADEFRERMKNTADIYSENGVKMGLDEVIMNYEKSIPIGQVQECGNLIFTFKSITEGEMLRLVGSLANTTEFNWQIQKRHYALFEITRADGQKLTENDYAPIRFLHFVGGFDPYTTNMCLEAGCHQIQIITDNVYYYAVDITDMLIFAEYDLYLTAFDTDGGFNMFEHIYASKGGDIILKDNAPEKTVMFRFNIDRNFADKATVKQFIKTYNIDSDRHFENYTK